MSLPYSYSTPLRGEPGLNPPEGDEYDSCEVCDSPVPEGDKKCEGCEDEEEAELAAEEDEEDASYTAHGEGPRGTS